MLKFSNSAALCVQLIVSTAVSLTVLQGFAAVNTRLCNEGGGVADWGDIDEFIHNVGKHPKFNRSNQN